MGTISAEHMAMRDISQHLYERAGHIIKLHKNRKFHLYHSYGFWDTNVHMVISKLFVSPKRLASKENRRLNRELGLSNINKGKRGK